MLVAIQWRLQRAPHLTSLAWVYVAWGSESSLELFALWRVTRSFDVFFDLRLNKRLRKYSRRRWFGAPSLSLWRHCNDTIFHKLKTTYFVKTLNTTTWQMISKLCKRISTKNLDWFNSKCNQHDAWCFQIAFTEIKHTAITTYHTHASVYRNSIKNCKTEVTAYPWIRIYAQRYYLTFSLLSPPHNVETFPGSILPEY